MSDYTLLVYRDFPEEAQLIHEEEEEFRDVPRSDRFAAIAHLTGFAYDMLESSPHRNDIRAMLAREKEAE